MALVALVCASVAPEAREGCRALEVRGECSPDLANRDQEIGVVLRD